MKPLHPCVRLIGNGLIIAILVYCLSVVIEQDMAEKKVRCTKIMEDHLHHFSWGPDVTDELAQCFRLFRVVSRPK